MFDRDRVKKCTIGILILLFSSSVFAGESAEVPVQVRWTEEEALFTRVLEIRAQALEKEFGIQFDDKCPLKAVIEEGVTYSQVGMYEYKSQLIFFVPDWIERLTKEHGVALRLLEPEVVAENKFFGSIINHELGHFLADQISVREGVPSWYLEENYLALSKERQLGLKLVSEGIATYFELGKKYFLSKDKPEECFPENFRAIHSWDFGNLGYPCSYWLVRDIINIHGELGIIWLVEHPFDTDLNNLRKSAVKYRERALHELSR